MNRHGSNHQHRGGVAVLILLDFRATPRTGAEHLINPLDLLPELASEAWSGVRFRSLHFHFRGKYDHFPHFFIKNNECVTLVF